MGHGVIGLCAQRAQVLHIPSLTKETRFLDDPLRSLSLAMESLLCAPFPRKGESKGVVFLYRCSERAFGREEEELLTQVAHALGEYLLCCSPIESS